MTKYLFIYRNPPATGNQPSPEEMQAMLVQWAQWKEKFSSAVVDMGDGLHPTGKVLQGGELSDGPFVEAKEIIGGFSIVQGETFEQVLEVAKACPISFMPGARIEIRQMMGF